MQGSFSLGSLLGTLSHSWKFLVIATLACAILAVALALLLPPRYRSGASLLPESDERGLSLAGMLGQAGIPLVSALLEQGGSADLQREILLSANLAQRVVAGLDLYATFELDQERAKDPAAAQQAAVAKLKAGLEAEVLPASQVLIFSVEAKDPGLCRDIALRYIEELERFNRELVQDSGRRKRVFLESRYASSQGDLAQAQDALAEFSAQNGVVHLPAELESQLALLAEMNRRLILKQLERAALAQDAAKDFPALRRIDAEIQVLRIKLAEFEAGKTDAVMRLKALDELPALALQYYELQRELRIQQEIANLLVQQLEQARLEESNDVPRLKVLDAPQAPTLPSWPPKKLLVVAITGLGFLLLCVFVLLRDFLRRVREAPQDKFGDWRWLLGGSARKTLKPRSFDHGQDA